MTERELLVAESHISALWAEEILRDRGGSLSSRQLFHIVWLATGDRQEAAKQSARRALDESRPQS